jgi:preprotein translocase subunit SecF
MSGADIAEATVRAVSVDDAATGRLSRAYRGQTAFDFVGRRRLAFGLSLVMLVLTIGSLGLRGLDLGIDFEGGVSWDVPGAQLSIAEAEQVLSDGGLDPAAARIQERASDSGEFIKIQVPEQSTEVQQDLQAALAGAAGVDFDDVSVNIVSSSWGREITDKAIRALVVFTLLVVLFISIRYEWRMALAAVVAMVHDVVISVGLYSLLGFVVTPATVIAFLTILGYSLYDTIVIFDRVRENEARYETSNVPYADVINTTMNQVLMRTLNTTASSMIPVLSILIIGAGVMGASALSEFAIALLVGMLTGAYSSIFVAAPLLALMRSGDERWRGSDADRALGEDLRSLVMGGVPTSVRSRTAASGRTGRRADSASDGSASSRRAAPSTDVTAQESVGAIPTADGSDGAKNAAKTSEQLLSHPPRPRRKKRR